MNLSKNFNPNRYKSNAKPSEDEMTNPNKTESVFNPAAMFEDEDQNNNYESYESEAETDDDENTYLQVNTPESPDDEEIDDEEISDGEEWADEAEPDDDVEEWATETGDAVEGEPEETEQGHSLHSNLVTPAHEYSTLIVDAEEDDPEQPTVEALKTVIREKTENDLVAWLTGTDYSEELYIPAIGQSINRKELTENLTTLEPELNIILSSSVTWDDTKMVAPIVQTIIQFGVTISHVIQIDLDDLINEVFDSSFDNITLIGEEKDVTRSANLVEDFPYAPVEPTESEDAEEHADHIMITMPYPGVVSIMVESPLNTAFNYMAPLLKTNEYFHGGSELVGKVKPFVDQEKFIGHIEATLGKISQLNSAIKNSEVSLQNASVDDANAVRAGTMKPLGALGLKQAQSNTEMVQKNLDQKTAKLNSLRNKLISTLTKYGNIEYSISHSKFEIMMQEISANEKKGIPPVWEMIADALHHISNGTLPTYSLSYYDEITDTESDKEITVTDVVSIIRDASKIG